MPTQDIPTTELTAPKKAKKSKPVKPPQSHIVWTKAADQAFEKLKFELTHTCVLQYPDPSLGYDIHTDASDQAIGGSLEQEGRPIAFFSRKLNSAEKNYMIYEREALALVTAVKAWHHLIHNGEVVNAFCDNKGVSCLLRQNFTIPRQARWAAILSQYKLRLHFKPGEDNVVADALTRQFDLDEVLSSEDLKLITACHHNVVNFVNSFPTQPFSTSLPYPRKPDMSCLHHRNYVLSRDPLNPTHSKRSPPLEETRLHSPLLSDQAVRQAWRVAYLADPHLCNIFSKFARGTATTGATPPGFVFSGGLLYKSSRVVVPETFQQNLLQAAHCIPQHLGAQAMAHRLSGYWWKGMISAIRNHCGYCLGCKRAKGSTGRLSGPPEALTPPTRPFQRLHFDLVGPIKPAKFDKDTSFNMLFTVLDAFSKFAWAIPCSDTISAAGIAKLFTIHAF